MENIFPDTEFSKDFKAVITNIFKELKKIIFRELKYVNHK